MLSVNAVVSASGNELGHDLPFQGFADENERDMLANLTKRFENLRTLQLGLGYSATIRS
jgi:hypothetical protein